MIRPATEVDAPAISRIYNHYIQNTIVSFEEVPVSADEMWQRIGRVTTNHPWIVFESNDEVIGYAYAGNWNSRAAYRHAVEVSVYLSPKATERNCTDT